MSPNQVRLKLSKIIPEYEPQEDGYRNITTKSNLSAEA